MEFGSVIELDENKYYMDCEKSIYDIKLAYCLNYRKYFFQSGRNAIEALLRCLYKKNSTILVPDFICETVKAAIVRANFQYIEYTVYEDMKINVVEINTLISKFQIKYVYISHLFDSHFTDDDITVFQKWKKEGVTIIEDVTLNLLATNKIGFGNHIIGSLRKWFAIPDGAFILSEEKLDIKKEKEMSIYTGYYLLTQTLKREYINDGYKNSGLKNLYMEYYKLSMKDIFSDYTIRDMSHISKVYLSNINLTGITERRQQNYDYLYNQIADIDKSMCFDERSVQSTPMMLVIKCRRRDDLLKYLIEHDIYCSVHWRIPSDKKNINYLSSHLLSIPCDQRYTKSQLQYIGECMHAWKVKNNF